MSDHHDMLMNVGHTHDMLMNMLATHMLNHLVGHMLMHHYMYTTTNQPMGLWPRLIFYHHMYSRQLSRCSMFHAGHYLDDKEICYLSTVIVTANVC